MTELTLSHKYAPLQRLTTRYAIVTGGRGSGKSFAIATMLIAKTEQFIGKTILFTRYTLTNAETSIMPEFTDKIERGNMQGRFHKSGNEITNLRTGTKILFRGIKTSTGINTAALKSIPNLALWVNDESEELVDETTFDTIDLSIRDQNEHCEVWLVLNPADISHFIYRKFFAGNGVDGGFNGIKGDTTYIHTSYLDNTDNLPADYVEKAERLRDTDPKKYAHLWLGEWEANREGLVYPNWEEITDADYPTGLQQWYGLDWGYTDPTAIVRECYDAVRGILYIKEVACAYESIPSEVAPVIIEDAKSIGYAPGECFIFCDSATPAGIAELARVFGLNAQEADKKDKDYQVSWLRGLTVKYIGENIRREVKTYSFLPSKFDKAVYTSTPQDGNDHFMDSCFVAETMIATPNGEKRIADIQEGDFVLTSQGPKRVLHKWSNGIKEVCNYEIKTVSCSINVTATKEHKVKTLQEWKPISKLREGDKVFLLRTSTERPIANMQGKPISQTTNGNFIVMFGSFIMDLFRKGIKSTIKTETPTTTKSAILNAYPQRSISKDTQNQSKNEQRNPKALSTSNLCRKKQRNGTKAKQDGLGIVYTERKLQNPCNPLNMSANVAERSIIQRIWDGITTAPINANQRQDETREQTMKPEFAPTAESLSLQTDSGRRNVARVVALQSIDGKYAGQREVFDLEVEDCHEYFANGLLVHNCRYGAFTFLQNFQSGFGFGFGSQYSILG